MNKIIKMVICLILIICSSGCNLGYEQINAEKSIYVNQQSLSLFIGEQIQLTASPTGFSFFWESEDTDVATVSSSGLVEAVGTGSTNIIASYDGVKTKVPVRVLLKTALENISVNVSGIEIGVGNELNVVALPVPSDANDFNRFFWSSDNENVAVVSPSGKVTALALGVANITVRAGDISKIIPVGVYRNTNVALKKPVTVSSLYASQYIGENAVDGILNTSDNTNRWVSQPVTGSAPQWITVDFGMEYKIHSLEFWTQSGYPCADFQLQKDVDGQWVNIFTQTGNTSVAYSKVFEETMARKVRLYFTKGSSDGIIRMYELRINAKTYE